MLIMVVLAKLKRLRGSPLDVFGYTAERRRERAFLARYETLLDTVCSGLNTDNYELAVMLASLPDDVRGFGPVRDSHMQMVGRQMDKLLAQFTDASLDKAG